MGRKILLIESTPGGDARLDDPLSAAGHAVIRATGAAEGLRVAAATRPDLILVDAHLPDSGATEICRASRSLDPGWSVVVIGEPGRPPDAAEFDVYLERPADPADLLEALRPWLPDDASSVRMLDSAAVLGALEQLDRIVRPQGAEEIDDRVEDALEAPVDPWMSLDEGPSPALVSRHGIPELVGIDDDALAWAEDGAGDDDPDPGATVVADVPCGALNPRRIANDGPPALESMHPPSELEIAMAALDHEGTWRSRLPWIGGAVVVVALAGAAFVGIPRRATGSPETPAPRVVAQNERQAEPPSLPTPVRASGVHPAATPTASDADIASPVPVPAGGPPIAAHPSNDAATASSAEAASRVSVKPPEVSPTPVAAGVTDAKPVAPRAATPPAMRPASSTATAETPKATARETSPPAPIEPSNVPPATPAVTASAYPAPPADAQPSGTGAIRPAIATPTDTEAARQANATPTGAEAVRPAEQAQEADIVRAAGAPPRPIDAARPVFTRRDIEEQQGGRIVLRVLVDESGAPIRVTVKNGVLGTAAVAKAIDAVLRTRYEPARLGGEPVRAWVIEAFDLREGGETD